MNELTAGRIELGRIRANPYQPREHEDAGHVAKIAESILAEGLLQAPVGRYDPGDVNAVQLAFGHTRLSAFRLLNDLATRADGGGRDLSETPGLSRLLARRAAGELTLMEQVAWDEMPVMIRDLSDEEMFRLAVSENLARRDLTPIEEARAMSRYRAEFGKTSVEIGALFGLSDSAVRNKLRLLDLPEPIQAKVRSGEISEGSARMLLGAQRAAPQAMTAAAERMASQGLDNPKAVGEAIREELRKTAYEMCAPWRDKAVAGSGLWAFGWTPDEDELPDLSRERLNKALEGLKLEGFGDALQMQRAWEAAQAGNVRELQNIIRRPEEQRQRSVDALMVLARPPACSVCPFYTRIDGHHYCGVKVCWERKQKVWMENEVRRLSAELGIPVYDRERDGAPYEELQSWNKVHEQYFEQRAEHLRLTPRHTEYGGHAFTKSYTVMVVSVRKEFQEEALTRKEKERAQAAAEKAITAKQSEIRARLDASNEYLASVAAPVLARALGDLSDGAVDILCRITFQWSWSFDTMKRHSNGDQRVLFWRKAVLSNGNLAIIPDDVRMAGPAACAKHLQGVARAWGKGMELPEDWIERAEQFFPREGENGQN